MDEVVKRAEGGERGEQQHTSMAEEIATSTYRAPLPFSFKLVGIAAVETSDPSCKSYKAPRSQARRSVVAR